MRMEEFRTRFYFRYHDSNGDGVLTMKELMTAICGSRDDLESDEINLLQSISSIDVEGTGQLTKEQYLEAVGKNPVLLASLHLCC